MSQPDPFTATAASDLLRWAIAGSVDDGKSTLLGRLLYDAKLLLEDQLDHVAHASRRRGGEDAFDLSLVTDGLRAEREQGITIDVAYRYFATPKRTFIVADTPGHIQYTRNMVTGVSTADLVVILVDVRHGVVEQTRRHTYIASLLGIRHVIFAVNKLDAVNYDQNAFLQAKNELTELADDLQIRDASYIPISALHGDNVVEPSAAISWFTGKPLLEQLETINVQQDLSTQPFRFPVQWIIRPSNGSDHRAYSGTIASGKVAVGDDITILPSGIKSRVQRIDLGEEHLTSAEAPLAVALHLEDAIDISRGDMVCSTDNQPTLGKAFRAECCWFSETALTAGKRFILKQTSRSTRVIIDQLVYRFDIEALSQRAEPASLEQNDIGRIHIRTAEPLALDPYNKNRTTGSFILIDEATNDTVGVGMIVEVIR